MKTYSATVRQDRTATYRRSGLVDKEVAILKALMGEGNVTNVQEDGETNDIPNLKHKYRNAFVINSKGKRVNVLDAVKATPKPKPKAKPTPSKKE